MRQLIVTGSLLILFVLFSLSASAQEPISIEVANESGVSGYQISVFGSGFGEAQGELLILGSSAEINYWTPTAIQAIVPTVADDIGELVINTTNGQTVSSPFTVYSIDPSFLLPPTQTYQNVLAGRQAIIDGFEWSYCQAQPDNTETKPELFLSNYRCGYKGIVRSGLVVLAADSSRNQTAAIAYQFNEPLAGDYVFQFMTDNTWYVRSVESSYLHSVPRDYQLEISADSTNGKNGTWESVVTIEGNNRSSRRHTFSIPGGTAPLWFRMYVTDGLTDHTEETEGRDFAIRQVKLFAATGEPTRPDAAAIYGDSLSADAFDALGPSGLPFAVKQLRGEGTSDLVFSSYGLSGQNSGGLTEQEKIPFDIYDALALDNAQREIRYWFVAIGTNDATNGVDAIDKPNTNINLYNARLEQFVSDAIARGVVPIVARIPDTDEAIGGWGDLGAKRHVLNVIDAVAAQYRLIPGPDLYADFRLNIETEESTYFGDDGTHHVDLGGQRLIKGWAEAFVRAFSVEEMRPLPRNGRDNAASSVQTATPETAAPTEAVATDNLQGASEFSMDVLESVMEVGSGETSAENSRPLWQAAALFGVLLLLSFGFVLLVFKKLAYI